MPVTLPLEVALQVVDRALPRRLDESRPEHRRRLGRLSRVCKAFNATVKPVLASRRIHFEGRQLSSISQLEQAARDEILVDISVASGVAYDPFDLIRTSGRAVKTFVHRGKARDSCSPADYNANDFPAPLAVEVVLEFLRPDVTPKLRSLVILGAHCFQESSATILLAKASDFARLDFLQLHFEHPTEFDLSPLRHVVPVLGCGPYCHLDYIQLTSLGQDLARWGYRNTASRVNVFVEALITAIKHGAGRKALFLPHYMGCDSDTAERLDTAIKDHCVTSVIHYYADHKIDTSPSKPFRRYLAKERLEGRM